MQKREAVSLPILHLRIVRSNLRRRLTPEKAH